MTDRLRCLALVLLLGLLSACSTPPSSPLGELPRTPQASAQQLLEQAQAAEPEQAALLRLSAAEQFAAQGNVAQAQAVLDQVPVDTLKPAQQLFAQTLQAEVALARDDPERAFVAIQHDSYQWLQDMPVDLQARSHLVRTRTFAANDNPLAAARERVFLAPLLAEPQATENQDAIWALVYALPAERLSPSGDAELDGWLALAGAVREPGTLAQQQAAVRAWQASHPQHPAAARLPEPVERLMTLQEQPLQRIALLLPMQGPLAGVSSALRDGFLAAHLQAAPQGGQAPEIRLYDSTTFASLDQFYERAKREGVELVVGPLDKDQVRELGARPQLPIPTLALNYTEANQKNPPQLFQFGLAAEDEAREVARRAWADGHRNAIALVPPGDWGRRVLDAFRQAWQAEGGRLVAAEPIGEPVALANQVAALLQLREGTPSPGSNQPAQPVRRQDVDFLFLAATPQQAQQVKPILAFQYAGDLPVYATSHLYAANGNRAQYQDLEGIRFAETPWLLAPEQPLRQAVERQWPQAGGSLGRLYAMGADAYLLAPRLNQLLALPDLEVQGLSGTLRLNPQQRIERSLPWAEFHQGEVRPVVDASANGL